MNQTISIYFHTVIFCLFLLPFKGTIQASEDNSLDREIHLSRKKGSVYKFLRDVSEQTGYLFIYDSYLIDNDRLIRLKSGKYTLHDAIYNITGDYRLQIDLVDNYILLRLPEKDNLIRNVTDNNRKNQHFLISGSVIDVETGDAILYASISILHTSTGTISNQDGNFQLMVPDSLSHAKLICSHIGYESREINLHLLKGKHIVLSMNPQVISLQEISIRAISPMQVLSEMLNHRPQNYDANPLNLTTFYREGINYRHLTIDLTESVLQIYKTGYKKRSVDDQVKLIKKRRVVNRQATDTVFPKMRSGINSCLILDIIKELPEFIDPMKGNSYMYAHTGMSVIDGRMVDIIFFKQKEYVQEPMYTGELFIDTQSRALVEIRFEINPELVKKATNMFVDRKSAGLGIDLQRATYIVSYKLADDNLYYINHVRGDIEFKVRRRKRLFSFPLHFWFEMVTCEVEKEHIRAFSRNERLTTTRVFAETEHKYDKAFWEHFNIILPEEELEEDIIRDLKEIITTD